DIDGWSWTVNDPALPAMTLPELATLAGFQATSGQPKLAAWRRTGDAPSAASSDPRVYVAAGAMLAILGCGVAAAIARRRGDAADSTAEAA
ncbi:MAG: hypothetical protein ACR2J8_00850, partial [Thermomicrobiales bacterium]